MLVTVLAVAFIVVAAVVTIAVHVAIVVWMVNFLVQMVAYDLRFAMGRETPEDLARTHPYGMPDLDAAVHRYRQRRTDAKFAQIVSVYHRES